MKKIVLAALLFVPCAQGMEQSGFKKLVAVCMMGLLAGNRACPVPEGPVIEKPIQLYDENFIARYEMGGDQECQTGNLRDAINHLQETFVTQGCKKSCITYEERRHEQDDCKRYLCLVCGTLHLPETTDPEDLDWAQTYLNLMPSCKSDTRDYVSESEDPI